MTVIVYRDGILAADCTTYLYGTTRSPGIVTKISRLRDGSLFSGSGKRAERANLRAWLETPNGDRPDTDESTCILVRPNRQITVFDGNDDIEFGEVPFYAIGTGGAAALGALYAGASAEEAVRIACKIDPFCGEPIQVERL